MVFANRQLRRAGYPARNVALKGFAGVPSGRQLLLGLLVVVADELDRGSRLLHVHEANGRAPKRG
jgi:hypothetical protein